MRRNLDDWSRSCPMKSIYGPECEIKEQRLVLICWWLTARLLDVNTWILRLTKVLNTLKIYYYFIATVAKSPITCVAVFATIPALAYIFQRNTNFFKQVFLSLEKSNLVKKKRSKSYFWLFFFLFPFFSELVL